MTATDLPRGSRRKDRSSRPLTAQSVYGHAGGAFRNRLGAGQPRDEAVDVAGKHRSRHGHCWQNITASCGATRNRFNRHSIGYSCSRFFYFRTMCFVGKSFFPCFFTRPGFLSCLRCDQPLANQVCESLQGIGAVLVLAARSLRFNIDDPVGGNATIPHAHEARFHLCWQRCGCLDVESKMNCCCNFVDILTAGALRSNRSEFNFRIRYFNLVSDLQHSVFEFCR